MYETLSDLATFLLLEPLQQQISDTLAAANAPQEVVASLSTCASMHGAEIVNRALAEPIWAAYTGFGVWVGLADSSTVLASVAPACVAAVEAARPFL